MTTTDDLLIKKRFKELAERAQSSGRYTYTPFLNLAEQDILCKMENELCGIEKSCFGGADGLERVVARFGSESEFGYDEPFPIACILAEPVNQKFSDSLTHRDILGALMALGIERSTTGDIVIRNNKAHIFVLDRMAEHIAENLTSAKHTQLKCSIVTEFDEEKLYDLVNASFTVASERLDCIAAAFCKLSRGKMLELIEKGLVFINGRQILSPSKPIEENGIVSIRGYGRFIYRGTERKTKKDRLVVSVDKYE